MPLLDQMVKIRWSHRSKNKYTVLGVPFTQFGEYFDLHISKVPDDVDVKVFIQCNSCQKIVPRKMHSIRNKQATYCSLACAGIAKNTSIKFNCEECGKPGEKTITDYNKHPHHFCSISCSSKSSNKIKQIETRVDCKCEQCGESYTVTKSQYERLGSRFCSVPCRNRWESENKRGTSSHFFAAELIPCTNCSTENYVSQHRLKMQKHHFCNTSCRQQWYAEVWSQQKDWKEISRKRAVNILQNNKLSTNTSCQKKVNEFLDSLFVPYINEYSCDFYAVDNYLVDHNLMIEVMGDYWHSNPNKYPDATKLNSIQGKRISKDKAKRTFILNRYKITVLYLWEHDINRNPQTCINLIMKYIQQSGVLDDYHSFNYHIDINDQLQLNSSLMNPHFIVV